MQNSNSPISANLRGGAHLSFRFLGDSANLFDIFRQSLIQPFKESSGLTDCLKRFFKNIKNRHPEDTSTFPADMGYLILKKPRFQFK